MSDKLHRELHETEVRLEVAEQRYQRVKAERDALIQRRARILREIHGQGQMFSH